MAKAIRVGASVALLATTAAAYTPPVTKSPTGKPVPKNSDARQSIRNMRDACNDSTRDKPVAANVDENKYQTYIQYREWAEKLEPGITSYDASIDPVSDITPAKFIPTCNKYFADYASGVGAANMPLSSTCEPRVKVFLKLANDRLTDAKTKGGKLGDVRSQLEHVRLALFGKYDMGFVVPRCATNDKFKKGFAPLKQAYDALEAAVVPLEAAKSLKFVYVVETVPSPTAGVTSLTLVHYVDLKTNQPVDPSAGRF